MRTESSSAWWSLGEALVWVEAGSWWAALSENTTFVWKNARQRMRAHQSHQWTKHACRGEENNGQTAFGQWRNLKFRVKITIWGDMHPCPWAWQVLHFSDRLNTEMNQYGGGGFLVFYNKCVNIQKTLLNSLNQNFPNDHRMVSQQSRLAVYIHSKGQIDSWILTEQSRESHCYSSRFNAETKL